MNKFTTNIENKDLNRIDQLNGTGEVSKKGMEPINDYGESLKGALNKYQATLDFLQEQNWITTTIDMLYSYQTEMFEYQNLPTELNKYRLEYKVLSNGSAAIVKVNDKLYACNYTSKEFNMYKEPTIIQINEPKSILNQKIYDIYNGEAVLFKNNYTMTSTYSQIFREMKDLEKVLFKIEQNTMIAGNKYLLNKTKGAVGASPDNNPLSNSLNSFLLGQDLAGEWFGTDGFAGKEEVFFTIKNEDNIDNLIRTYTFLKENIKEKLGGEINIHQKKERVITDEVEQQQGLAVNVNKERFGVRKLCIDELNEKFGTNILINLTGELLEEETMEEDNNE